MTEEQLSLVLALAVVVIAGSFAVISWSAWRLTADARRTARATEELATMLNQELPPTLTAMQRISTSLDQLAEEGGRQLATVDRVASEAQETMAAVRDLSTTVNEIMRGPADTVTGVRKSARMVGDGIASGADRIRRVIKREDEVE
jgi:methyl-accepting chemotaxis protein